MLFFFLLLYHLLFYMSQYYHKFHSHFNFTDDSKRVILKDRKSDFINASYIEVSTKSSVFGDIVYSCAIGWMMIFRCIPFFIRFWRNSQVKIKSSFQPLSCWKKWSVEILVRLHESGWPTSGSHLDVPKMIMDSSINGRLIILFKKFSSQG